MAKETQDKPQQQDAEPAAEAAAAEAQAEGAEPQAGAAQAEGAADLPENEVTIEDAGTLKKKVTVEIPRKRIDAKFDEMFGELGHSAQVPGFRVGRAPRRLIEKRFGKEVAEDVRNAVLGEAMGAALEGKDLKVVGEPDIKLEEIKLPDEGALTFSFEVEVAPEFELPEYKGIEIRRPEMEVTDQRLEEAIAGWLRGFGRVKPVEGAARADDVVVANVTVTGDGIDFQAPNLELRVAPAQIEGIPVEDLPKALAGNKAGDTCTMKTKVPSGHPNESWRDKDVTLTLAVQEIKRLEAPELDEDLARQASFGSVEELRETFRSNLEVRVAAEQVRSMHGQVKTYFLEQTDFDVPEGVASRHASRLLARRYVDLLIQGVSREQLDENIQELEAAAASQAAQETKLSFILDKLIEAEGIEVSDAEVNARIAQIARRQRRRPERLRQELSNEGTLDHLTTAIREEKAIDKVLESAKIVEAPAEAAPAKADAAKGGKKAPAKTTKKGASRKKRSRASKEKG